MINWTHLITFFWVFLEFVGLYILSLSFFKIKGSKLRIMLAVGKRKT